ncbi:putative RDD family membrane protein YckC [Actinocorallia herbida]|uniref:Putative RDD family membrane protein YckC n=1 Tax=Actinocorallia herbida TaxID=58109 RepID=A0A3N1D8X1_9ACTN|nr:RDD family protein [Actinocorallia herbida]ROO89983.1 putative RDD family membrane protein YckC [Actinocorallia herbida]
MTVTSAELVTGEAVALDLRPARLASRASALLLDLAIMFAVVSTLMQAVQFVVLVADEAVAVGLSIVVTVGTFVGYPAISETLTRGKSVGKMALGLRVVAVDGGVVRFRQALMRALTGFVEFLMFMGAPALICSLFNREGRRLGDLFAGTLVIQDRTAATAALPPPAMMPPHLAPWAAALELSQISDDLALSARQYLLRYWELLPDVRVSMGASLLQRFLPLLSPPPPPGNPPELLLTAVLAERRTREERRLAARKARRVDHLRRTGQHIPTEQPSHIRPYLPPTTAYLPVFPPPAPYPAAPGHHPTPPPGYAPGPYPAAPPPPGHDPAKSYAPSSGPQPTPPARPPLR